ncbi:multiheme c-type cytochrome [Paraferrimonas haliotis]|uniref:Outer membrane cytochrome MtrC/MtrF-like domain-containing protein n=1 Tax=Paraferrimonas haliotis TaxID=2013866 RepID=A0AA37TT57_9GAMM|nr:hypothetical protein [Paraferrimonas haliotis]GLS85005.1 hypothetical protein GCM10007894_29820 [Paraferrimonas haliotis]
MTCHVDYATTSAKHAGFVGSYSNLIDGMAGEMAFVDSCLGCHNQVTKGDEASEGGYATNTMQKIGHINHQKFSVGFEVTNCTSCHTAPITNTDRGCVDCHGDSMATVATSMDWAQVHSEVAERKAFIENHPMTASLREEGIDGANGFPRYCVDIAVKDFDIKQAVDEGRLESPSYPGDPESGISAYIHGFYEPTGIINYRYSRMRAGTTYENAIKTYNADGSVSICADTAEIPSNINAMGSIRLTIDGAIGVTGYTEAYKRKIVVSDDTCITCHNAVDHYHRGGFFAEGGQSCIACHNAGYARNAGAGYGPMVHSHHFGAKAAEKQANGQATSLTKLNGANCVACHADGTLKLNEVSSAMLLRRNDVQDSNITANCQGCHTSDAAASHMTSQGGLISEPISGSAPSWEASYSESCAVCHDQGKTYGIDKYHNL